MPRLECFLVSQSIILDQLTRSVSLFNVLEGLGFTTFPNVLRECAAFTLLEAEKDDFDKDWQVELRIEAPGGNVLIHNVNFKFTTDRHRIIQQIGGIPVTSEGRLRFELKVNGQHFANHFVTIKKIEEIDQTIRKLT